MTSSEIWAWRLSLARRIVHAGPYVLALLEGVLLFDSEEPPVLSEMVPAPRDTGPLNIEDDEQMSSFLAEVLVEYRQAKSARRKKRTTLQG